MDELEKSRTDQGNPEVGLDLLFNNVDTLLWSISEDSGGVLFYETVNAAYAAIEDKTPEDYIGKEISAVHLPAQCKAIKDSLERVRDGRVYEYEAQFGDAKKRRFFNIKVMPVPDKHGLVHRFVGSATDITELKNVQSQLQIINDELEIRIGRRTAELQKAHDELEVKVRERTLELEETNKALRIEIAERKHAEEMLQRRARESSILADLTRKMYTSGSVEDVLFVVSRHLALIFPAYVAVSLIEEGGRFLRVKAHNVDSKLLDFAEKLTGLTFADLKLPLYEDTVVSRAMRTGHPLAGGLDFEPDEPVIKTDINQMLDAMVERKSPLRAFAKPIAERLGKKSLLGMPFSSSSGSIIGTVTVLSDFLIGREDFDFMKTVSGVIGQAVDHLMLNTKIRESEDRYRVLTDNALVGVYIYDKGKFLFVNKAMEQITGYSMNELIGMDTKTLEVPDNLKTQEIREEIRLQEDENTREYPMHLCRKDGGVVALEFRSHPIIYDGKKVIMGNCIDVTERKASEEASERGLKYFKSVNEFAIDLASATPETDLFELTAEKLMRITGAMAVGISSFDNDSMELRIRHIAIENPLLAKVNKLLGRNIKDMRMTVSPEMRERMLAEVVAVSEDFAETTFGAVPKPVADAIMKVLGIKNFTGLSLQHAGKLVGSLVVVMPRGGPELELDAIRTFASMVAVAFLRRQAEVALREGECKYRSLVERANDGIAIIQNLVLKYVNPRLANMLEYSTEEMNGTKSTDYAQADEVSRLVDIHMRRMKGENVPDLYETVLLSKTGRKIDVEVNAGVITFEGKPATLAFYRDITERKIFSESISREREAFSIIADASVHSESIPDLCYRVLRGLVHTLGFDVGTVQLYDPVERTLNLKAMSGLWADRIFESDPPQPVDDPRFVGTLVAKSRVPIFAPDITEHPVYKTHRDRIDENKIQALISWPLLGINRTLLGIIQLMGMTVREIPEEDRKFFESVVEMFALALEHKTSEEALRESEERLRSIFENSTIGLYRTTPDGRILMANPAIQKMLGYSSLDELASRNLEEEGYEPGYSRSDFKKRMEKEGGVSGLESCWVRRDGSTIHVRESARLVCDPKGEPKYYEGTVEDITEHKNTERALKESEERFRSMVENINDVIFSLDTRGIITYVSPVARKVLEYEAGDVLGKNFSTLIFPEDLPGLEGSFKETLAGKLEPYEFRMFDKRGRVRWVRTSSQAVLNLGKPSGITGILSDITERKLAEESLTKAYRARMELEQIVNQSEAVIFLWRNAEGWPVEFVSGNIKSYGYSPEELYTGKVKYADIVHPEDLARVAHEVELYSGEGRTVFMQEYRIVTRDGDIIWVDDRTLVRRNNDGLITHYQGIVMDITRRKEVEQALAESESKYREMAESLPESIAEMDLHGNITYANRIAFETFGYSKEDLKRGLNAFRMVSSEDREAVREGLARISTGENAGPGEYTAVRKDGSRFPVVINSNAIIRSGELVGIRSILTNITVIKSVEEELQQIQDFLTSIVENIPDMISVKDAVDLKYIMLNKAGEELLGYPKEEVLGRTDSDLFPDSDEARLTNKDLEIIESKRLADESEAVFETKNKGRRTLRTKKIPVFDEKGTPRYLLGISEDITDRKRTQDLLEIQRDLGTVLSVASSLDEALPFSLQASLEVTDMDSGGIYLIDSESGRLKLFCSRGLSPEFVEKVSTYEPESPRTKLVMKGVPVYTRFREFEPNACEEFQKEGLIALAVIPIHSEAEIVGCLNVASHSMTEIPLELRSTLESVATHIGAVLVRLRAEQGLRESEEKYRNLIENAGESIVVVQDGLFKFINPKTFELAGYKQEEFIQKSFIELVHPEDKKMVAENYSKRIKGEDAPYSYIFRVIDKSGDTRWVEIRTVMITWVGKPATLNFLSDITERRKAEEDLIASEEKHRLLLNSIQTPVLALSKDMRIFYCNKAYADFVGRTEGSLEGKKLIDLFPQFAYTKSYLSYSKAMKTGEIQTVEGKVGSSYLHAIIYPMPWGILSVASDITQRIKMENEIVEERDRAQKYLDVAAVIMLVINPDRTIGMINRRGCEILGFPEAEITGKNWFENFLPGHSKDNAEYVFDILMKGNDKYAEYNENSILTKDKGERLIAWHNTTLRDDKGKVIGILSSGEDITERRKAEDLLRESEERYRIFTEEALVGVYIYSNDRYLFVNQEMEEITGYSKAELLRMNPSAYSMPTDRILLEKIKLNSEVDSSTEYMISILRKNGETAFLEVRVRSIPYDKGIAYLGNCIDITDRVRQAKQIEQAKMEWEKTFDAISDLVMIVDSNGRLSRANRSAIEYSGSTPSMLEGRNFLEVFHVNKTDGLNKFNVDTIRSKFPSSFEIKDPREKHEFWVSASPLQDDAGNLLGTVCVARDVSQLRRMEQALVQSEAQFRGLAESATDIIFNIDEDGFVRYFNPALKTILGYEPSEFMGVDVRNVNKARNLLSLFQQLPLSALRKQESARPLFEVDIRDLKGRLHTMEVSVRFIARQFIGVIRDITARKRMEQQLLRASKLASVGVLAAGLAHQINNPLASILATTTALNEMLKRQEDVPKDVKEKTERYIGKMEDQLDRTHKIVSSLLEFAQQKRMDIKPQNTNETIRNSLQFISQHLSLKEVELDLELLDDLPQVMVDKDALQEALLNVLQNAYEAIDGKGRISILTEVEAARIVRIRITNNGPIIPAQIKDEIFELLFSTKTERKGTGLGLPIASMLLEHFGGRIYLEESTEEQTTFVVEVPIYSKEDE